MKRALIAILSISIIIACTSTPELPATQPSISTDARLQATSESVSASPAATDSVAVSTIAAPEDGFFSEMGISLPAPVCSVATQQQTEGPYYTPDTPERNSLIEEGMQGTRLIVVGYVLDQNCQPLSNAWLDFWQADANGEYDNAGFALRGHQFADAQGRYFLETVRPGEYPGRTEHIHVKVQPSGGSVTTTQLYFPDVFSNQGDGIFEPTLIVQLEDRGDYLLAYFNFVVPT